MIAAFLARELHWWRVAHLGGGGLIRPVDRMESALQACIALLTVVALPIVIVACQAVHSSYSLTGSDAKAIAVTVLAGAVMLCVGGAAYCYLALFISTCADEIRNKLWDEGWARLDADRHC